MSALKDLLQSIEAEIHLSRRDSTGTVAPIVDALLVYEQAIEEERVAKYCRDHSIRPPSLTTHSPIVAARNLLSCVENLPEFLSLRAEKLERMSEGAPLPAAAKSTGKSLIKVEEPDSVELQFISKFPELTSAAEHGKLLIFGAFSGRTKRLPRPLEKSCDWIDTAGDGNRAVSNAVRRIRNGHVFSVIICDQSIAHQHAEPVVASARGQKIPIGYAGKGGNASLARALETLEEKLRS